MVVGTGIGFAANCQAPFWAGGGLLPTCFPELVLRPACWEVLMLFVISIGVVVAGQCYSADVLGQVIHCAGLATRGSHVQCLTGASSVKNCKMLSIFVTRRRSGGKQDV